MFPVDAFVAPSRYLPAVIRVVPIKVTCDQLVCGVRVLSVASSIDRRTFRSSTAVTVVYIADLSGYIHLVNPSAVTLQSTSLQPICPAM